MILMDLSAYFTQEIFTYPQFLPYVKAVGLFFVLVGIFGIIQKIVLKQAEKFSRSTKTDIDDTLVKIIKSIKPAFYWFLSFYIASNTIKLSGLYKKGLQIFVIAWATYQVIIALHILIEYVFDKYKAREESKTTQEALETLTQILKGALWVLGVLFLLQNLGINVTSLVAGLGIGGVAIALAAQSILGDLFSSFAILFDKPFEPGDFIIVGNYMGVVEDIGIKTTRLRALQGEEIVISNTELTSSKIQNFKKMRERRVPFKFGILYETEPDTLIKVNQIVERIIKKQDKTRFDRCNLVNFGDYALEFEVVYYVLSGDYNEFLNIHENILLSIYKEFKKQNIILAYPTQTLYISKTKQTASN